MIYWANGASIQEMRPKEEKRVGIYNTDSKHSRGCKGPDVEKPPLLELNAVEAAGTSPPPLSNLPPGPLPGSPTHVSCRNFRS